MHDELADLLKSIVDGSIHSNIEAAAKKEESLHRDIAFMKKVQALYKEHGYIGAILLQSDSNGLGELIFTGGHSILTVDHQKDSEQTLTLKDNPSSKDVAATITSLRILSETMKKFETQVDKVYQSLLRHYNVPDDYLS